MLTHAGRQLCTWSREHYFSKRYVMGSIKKYCHWCGMPWTATRHFILLAGLRGSAKVPVVASTVGCPCHCARNFTCKQWFSTTVLRLKCSLKVPDAFQQKLSAEKTPTLCNAIPSFDAMVTIWKGHQESWGEPFSSIIQDGLDKLNAYHDRIDLVPAYTISMSKSFIFFLHQVRAWWYECLQF